MPQPKVKPRPKPAPAPTAKIALVLGGGGLKGFAHIGVLAALAEKGIKPTVLAGTSIGSLICAAQAAGMPIDDMTDHAKMLRRRDLFRLNRLEMLLERSHAPSIYQGGPLRAVLASIVGDASFDDLDTKLLVNTVDLQRGSPLVWGLPGLRDVSVLDAVYASCALPGFYPPGDVGGRSCVDGGVVDNLPVGVASQGMDAVIAVDTGSSSLITEREIARQGFTAIYMRAATTMMHALQLSPLENWSGPPMILIRPRVSHIGWFSFSHTEELIDAGYRAAMEALQRFEECMRAETGIFPRRAMHLSVEREKCIGCSICVALAPQVMEMDGTGKAVPRMPVVDWSPADGDFVHHCPTYAIRAEPAESNGVENQPVSSEAKTPEEREERLEAS
ncbi:MAG TPA: patatin-like phospholipase family protein [Gemmatimonadaceae bacterium]|nr:patatin-like phospholipase family protein [Gemmatimonadaceae bacterium]